MTLYNVEKVLERVSNLQPEESRLIFAEEIFDWTDNYTETLLPNPNTPEAKKALESIATLWIKYATMEQNLRQWKKAVQVYDDALNDAVASRSLSVYISYAELCKLRGKISNAQKVYIKALTAGFTPQETDVIWKDFLHIMRDSAPELTVDQLYAAVSSQVGDQSLTKPSPNFQDLFIQPEVVLSEKNQIKVEGEPASKRIKTETEINNTNSNTNTHTNTQSTVPINIIGNNNVNTINNTIPPLLLLLPPPPPPPIIPTIPSINNNVVINGNNNNNLVGLNSNSNGYINNTPIITNTNIIMNNNSNNNKSNNNSINPINNSNIGSNNFNIAQNQLLPPQPFQQNQINSLTNNNLHIQVNNGINQNILSNKLGHPTESTLPLNNNSTTTTTTTNNNNAEFKIREKDNEVIDPKLVHNQPPLKIQAPSTLLNLQEISTTSIDELLKLHSNRPTMLFRPLTAEDIKQITQSPGAGFNNINKSLVNDVEGYFTMKIPLLCEIDRNVPDSKISRVLDIIESLWISQGLSERYFDYWFSNLIQSQLKEESILKTKFFEDEKLLIGNTSNTANGSTSLDILRSKQKIELRNFRIKNELQIQILNAYVNSVMENILQDQLIVVSLIDGFPHRVLDKIEGGDGEMQEEFALLKQIVNALLSIRLHTRTQSNQINKKKPNTTLQIQNTNLVQNPTGEKKIQEIQGEWEEDIDENSKITTLEGARAAALAARKTTFKKKRRKIPEITSRYYTSHYGSTTVEGQSIPTERFRSPFPGSNDQESTNLSLNQNSTSNLHKLAALLGKAKK